MSYLFVQVAIVSFILPQLKNNGTRFIINDNCFNFREWTEKARLTVLLRFRQGKPFLEIESVKNERICDEMQWDIYVWIAVLSNGFTSRSINLRINILIEDERKRDSSQYCNIFIVLTVGLQYICCTIFLGPCSTISASQD